MAFREHESSSSTLPLQVHVRKAGKNGRGPNPIPEHLVTRSVLSCYLPFGSGNGVLGKLRFCGLLSWFGVGSWELWPLFKERVSLPVSIVYREMLSKFLKETFYELFTSCVSVIIFYNISIKIKVKLWGCRESP